MHPVAVTNPLLDMQRTETNELMRYVDEGKDSWRFAGFVCSLLLVVVSLLSVFVNILQVIVTNDLRLHLPSRIIDAPSLDLFVSVLLLIASMRNLDFRSPLLDFL